MKNGKRYSKKNAFNHLKDILVKDRKGEGAEKESATSRHEDMISFLVYKLF